MKKTIFGVMILLAGVAISCTNEMDYKDASITPVKSLYEPSDGKSVALATSATASLTFAWEACKAEDSGSPLYEVLFFTPGGTEPIYAVTADGVGFRNYATILHKDLNKICKAAGFGQGNTGTLEWTVRSSRGLNEEVSNQRYKLTITTIEGLDEIPTSFYITGSASEGGADVSKAMAFASPEAGIFEIFCELKSGEYYFTDKPAAGANRYYLDGLKVKEGENTVKVSKPGIYWITCDLNVVAATITEVKTMGWYFSPTNKIEILMPYVGGGVFSGSGVTNFQQESWGRDERYKLSMQLGDDSWIWWGTKNGTDSRPGDGAVDNPADPYWQIQEKGPMYDAGGNAIDRWNDKWKLHGRYDGANTKISAYFNVGTYYHFVELAN